MSPNRRDILRLAAAAGAVMTIPVVNAVPSAEATATDAAPRLFAPPMGRPDEIITHVFYGTGPTRQHWIVGIERGRPEFSIRAAAPAGADDRLIWLPWSAPATFTAAAIDVLMDSVRDA